MFTGILIEATFTYSFQKNNSEDRLRLEEEYTLIKKVVTKGAKKNDIKMTKPVKKSGM